MDFSKLRHRIVFLKPTETRLNGMKENIPVYVPIKPTASETPAKVYVTVDADGNAALDAENGVLRMAPWQFVVLDVEPQ